MSREFPIDGRPVETVADVEPHYEAKQAVIGAADVLVDPGLVDRYTFNFVHDWGLFLAAAGDVSDAGTDAEGRHNLYSDRALMDRGLEYSSYEAREAVDDILSARIPPPRSKLWDGYQTAHPFLAPRFPEYYVSYDSPLPPAASTEETHRYMGAILADRFARLDAMRIVMQNPDLRRWLHPPATPIEYVRAYTLDHISSLMEDALTFGLHRSVYGYAREAYGDRSGNGGQLKRMNFRDSGGPAVGVSTLRAAFRLYDNLTEHYGLGYNLEEAWADPVDTPEIALANEYVYSACTLAASMQRGYRESKQSTDEYYKHVVAAERNPRYNAAPDPADNPIAIRDAYGDALAGLQAVHEVSTFALVSKFRDRVDYIARDIGRPPIRKSSTRHRTQHAKSYAELAAMREVLQAAMSSDELPVNSLLVEDATAVIRGIDRYCGDEADFHWRDYRYKGGGEHVEEYTGRNEKRYYRTYPRNRQYARSSRMHFIY